MRVAKVYQWLDTFLRRGERPCFLGGPPGEQRSYREFVVDIDRCVLDLEAKIEVDKVEFLIHSSEDLWQTHTFFWAAAALGLAYLPLSKKGPREDLARFFGDAYTVFEGDRLIEEVRSSRQRNSHQAALVIFTSGSMGQPKAVAHGFDALVNSAQATIDFYSAIYRCKDSSGPNALQSIPTSHIGGFMLGFRTFICGGTLMDLGDASSQLGWICHPGPIDVLSLVPTQLYSFMDHPDAVKKLRQARLILVSGARIPQDLRQKAIELSLPVSFSYGSTETGSQIAATPLSDPLGDYTLLAGRSVWISGEQLMISGNTLLLGYCERGLIVSPLEGGYLPAGDHGALVDGKLKVFGRNDGTYKCGGRKISQSQFEDILRDHGVRGFRVLMAPDDQWGVLPRVQTIDVDAQHECLEKAIALLRTLLPRSAPEIIVEQIDDGFFK